MMDTVTSPLLGVYNMTRPDNELEYLQHGHDLTGVHFPPNPAVFCRCIYQLTYL